MDGTARIKARERKNVEVLRFLMWVSDAQWKD
jgi:hypothetical protein